MGVIAKVHNTAYFQLIMVVVITLNHFSHPYPYGHAKKQKGTILKLLFWSNSEQSKVHVFEHLFNLKYVSD